MLSQENNVGEEVAAAGSGEIYQPGTLKQLSLEAVVKHFYISQFTNKDLPLTVIDDLYYTYQNSKQVKYVQALITEFSLIEWHRLPYKFIRCYSLP